eukprot:1086718-Pleurochrysis_carterae.AAC.6
MYRAHLRLRAQWYFYLLQILARPRAGLLGRTPAVQGWVHWGRRQSRQAMSSGHGQRQSRA